MKISIGDLFISFDADIMHQIYTVMQIYCFDAVLWISCIPIVSLLQFPLQCPHDDYDVSQSFEMNKTRQTLEIRVC